MKTDVKTEVNADSSTEDILKAAEGQEAKSAEESTANEQEAEGQGAQSGKDVKTDQKVSDEDELDKGLKEGQAIPYDRFKKVNEERKALKARIEEFEKGQGEDDELDAILKDPEVAALILKKQGYTDEAIAAKFKEAGIEAKAKDEKEPEFDLTTVEGWNKNIAHLISKELDRRLGPVEKTLTETQHKEQVKAFNERMDKEATEAAKICKEVYGIEYGDEKDAKDPTTGAGKILNYLQKHPEKATAASHGALTKSDLLRLALADEGVKLGEKKGEKKVNDRMRNLKDAAMEGETESVSEKVPTKESSVDEILAYKQAHPNWKP